MSSSFSSRFFPGFLRNFFVLLLLFGGIRMWQSGQIWLALLQFALAGGVLIAYFVFLRKKRASESDRDQ